MQHDEETERGVQAIIDIQQFAGINEPPERARIGWRLASVAVKKLTMDAHRILFPEKYIDDIPKR